MAIIMSWGKCAITVGPTGAADALAAVLSSIGTIKDKSTGLEVADGDKLEAKATGGELVGFEELDGEMTLTTRVIEPDFVFLATLMDATHDVPGKTLTVSSMLIAANQSVELVPKNVGGMGIQVRKSSLKIKKGFSDDEGWFADLSFTILKCADGELYKMIEKQ